MKTLKKWWNVLRVCSLKELGIVMYGDLCIYVDITCDLVIGWLRSPIHFVWNWMGIAPVFVKDQQETYEGYSASGTLINNGTAKGDVKIYNGSIINSEIGTIEKIANVSSHLRNYGEITEVMCTTATRRFDNFGKVLFGVKIKGPYYGYSQGIVVGDLFAVRVNLFGSVFGGITAKSDIILYPGSTVDGDVVSENGTIFVYDGVKIGGAINGKVVWMPTRKERKVFRAQAKQQRAQEKKQRAQSKKRCSLSWRKNTIVSQQKEAVALQSKAREASLLANNVSNKAQKRRKSKYSMATVNNAEIALNLLTEIERLVSALSGIKKISDRKEKLREIDELALKSICASHYAVEAYNRLHKPRKASSKKTPVKKTPAKKTPVKKTPVKKTPVKKLIVKKVPVKKVAKDRAPVTDVTVKKVEKPQPQIFGELALPPKGAAVGNDNEAF